MKTRDEHIDVIRELAVAEARKEFEPHWSLSRRGFIKSSAAAALVVPFGLLGAGRLRAQVFNPDYGPLAPVEDEATGLPLLQLPEGFRYWSFGWTGDVMDDGIPTPGAHDGMAVVAANSGRYILVRNHEQGSHTAGAFAAPELTYDPGANGGTTTLFFAPNAGKKWIMSRASISGTIRNCAGGPTPWKSWITCEETTNGPHNGAMLQHGYCFDVPAFGEADPVPLIDMGCFSHEALAVDPRTGLIYETEDSTPSGLYRFIPNVPGRPALGGRLQMMRLTAEPNANITILGTSYPYYNTGVSQTAGATWDVEWVDIDEPDKPFVTGTSYGGVRAQGLVQGASSIVRGEGIWYGDGIIYVCSTSGGGAGRGQIFAYDPVSETFSLVYESPNNNVLSNPDNIAWSPRGSLVLCEDGSFPFSRMHGLTTGGELFPFCFSNLDFRDGAIGPYTRPSGRTFTGDRRGDEFAGATFQDEWLFVNSQGGVGVTFAITGPWESGAL